MARSDLGELEQLREHAQLLIAIQNKLFEQVEKGSITDDISQGSPDEIMPRIFAIESALVPLGALSMVSSLLRDESSGYSRLEENIQRDSKLQDLSIDFLRGKDRARWFTKLYQQYGKEILSFVEAIQKTQVVPKPYGKFVDFDMEVWALACLLDFKDVFFQRQIDSNIAKQQEFEKKIDGLVSNRLDDFDFAREGRGGINSVSRVGWYGSMASMERLSELQTKRAQQHGLVQDHPNVAKALKRTGGWDALIEELANHDAIAETVLLSTRSVCAFVVLAHDVLALRKGEEGGGAVSTFFDNIEKDVLRTDGFAAFCLGRLRKYKQIPRLPLEEIDPFIHLTGILAFALSRGYFSPNDNKNEIRATLKEFDFNNRGEIIDAIMDKFRDVGDLLVRGDSEMYDQENRFVATADLARLYTDDGALKLLRSVEDKAAIGDDNDRDDHSFQFVVSLPIAIKALAQLSIDERLDRMTAVHHDQWTQLTFAPWLERVEQLGERLVGAMSELNVHRAGNVAWGVWKGKHDWSVTAAVVDALGLWCAALACRYALTERIGQGPDVSNEFSTEDQKVVAAFFGLLKQHTAPKPAAEGNGANDESLEWIRILRQVSSAALNFEPRDNGADPSKSLGLENIFRVVAMIQHIRRELGTPLEVVVPTVRGLIKQVLETKKKMDTSDMFVELCLRIRKEFPKAFSEPEPAKSKTQGHTVEYQA